MPMPVAASEANKFYKLGKLVAWEHVNELNKMLMDGVAPSKVSEWARLKGFSVSTQKLYEYKGMLKSAITRGITVENILGIGTPRVSIQVLEPAYKEIKTKVRNELEVLDLLIQKGYENLLDAKTVTVTDTLKAIEMKNKLTQGQHAGLTEFGLEQVRQLEDMKFTAILDIIKKYVPSENWEEMDTAIANVEHAYYEEHAPEYLKQYEDAQMDRDL